MRAIFKREFKAYLHSVVGFLFVAVMVFFFGLYANVYHFMQGYANLAYTMSSIVFLFLITIPILSMRILADERRQKTDQLMLTAPVSVGKIVLGKYLAMSVIFLIPVAGMCVLPVFLQRFGTVPFGESYTGILAFTLYGLACIAVGTFISSLTESQVIAAVLSFGALFITYMMSGIQNIISSTGNLFTRFLGIFDFETRFSNMMNGNLDLNSVVYFITVIVLMLYLTTQSIQKRRYSMSVKNISMSAYSSGSIIIVIVICVVVNMAFAKLPTRYTNIDVTTNKLYTITEQTKNILANLNEDINIYVINSEDSADLTIVQTLKSYTDASSHIKVSYIDPLINPQFAYNYTTSNVTQDSLIVESQKRNQFINYNDLYETEIDYQTYSQNVTGYDGEGKITSAIAYCTSDDMPKIYMIAGHNEYTIDSGFTKAIEKENITYETISLMEYETIPEDAKCVIIHAPETDFSADDAKKIKDYLNNGGKVLITTEYAAVDMPNFESILEDYGMTLQKGYALDSNPGNYYQTPIFLLPEIAYEPETSGLTGAYNYIIAPYAQGVEVPDDSENIIYTKLLTCSDSSLVKTNVSTATSYDYEEGDIEGPICIGVKAEKELESGTGTLYVFTSAQMFTDNADSAVSGNNKALFSNIMGTVADHDISVAIPVKSYTMEYLTFNAQSSYIFLITIVGILPLSLVVIGLVIWMKRRKM